MGMFLATQATGSTEEKFLSIAKVRVLGSKPRLSMFIAGGKRFNVYFAADSAVGPDQSIPFPSSRHLPVFSVNKTGLDAAPLNGDKV
jgi:hypothetical protein